MSILGTTHQALAGTIDVGWLFAAQRGHGFAYTPV
jgi:hypothetical protein